MTLSEYICGTTADCLQQDEVLLETTRRSLRVRTRQSLLSLVLVAVVAGGYTWSLWERTNPAVLTSWVIVILALTLWRSMISKRIRGTLEHADAEQLVYGEADLVLTGIAIPVVVGAGYWLFCTPQDSITTLIVTLLCCLYAIGSTINTVAQRRMQGLMVMLNLGQGVAYFASLGTVEDYAIAVQVLALTLLLLGFGKRMHELFVDLVKSDLEIKVQNEQLQQNRIEIETALDEAVEANRTKSNFLAAASHDLSQPLHAMSMFIENLKQQVTEDEKQKDLVQKIENTSEILKQQFDGLLDMSRYDAGGVTVQKQSFDLYALCELLVQGEAITAEAKNLEIVITGDRMNVDSDPVLLGRLVGNLLANAIKFTEQGTVALHLQQSDERVMLKVTDTGCGFSDAEQEKIFQDFVQLDNSARNRSKGVGLGLSIVRRISDLLGIDVEVTSNPGVGSEFTLHITRGESIVASLHHDRSASAARYLDQSVNGKPPQQVDLDGQTILVTDDDPYILDAISEYVRCRGGEVLAASTPAQAQEYCQSHPIDFAIVDDMLGKDESGLDLATSIANDIAMKCIIIVTGNILPARMEILRSSGFGIYSKPLSAASLDEILHTRLTKGQRKATA